MFVLLCCVMGSLFWAAVAWLVGGCGGACVGGGVRQKLSGIVPPGTADWDWTREEVCCGCGPGPPAHLDAVRFLPFLSFAYFCFLYSLLLFFPLLSSLSFFISSLFSSYIHFFLLSY